MAERDSIALPKFQCVYNPASDFKSIRRSADFEFTVELYPLDVDTTLLDRLKSGGVNRISKGVQSFDDETLKAMGRPHGARQAREAWKMIRDAGFDNAGVDLICGWPGNGWNRTLESAAALDPDHCSVYTLILEPALFGTYRLPDQYVYSSSLSGPP